MKIKSRYVDFYDYVTGIVGFDKSRLYYRETSVFDNLKDISKISADVININNKNYKAGLLDVKIKSLRDFCRDSGFEHGLFKIDDISRHINVNDTLQQLVYSFSSKLYLSSSLFSFGEMNPAIVVVGGFIHYGFSVTKTTLTEDGREVNNLELIMTLNAFEKYLSGFDSKENTEDLELKKLLILVKYFIYIANESGIGIDGVVPFGKPIDAINDDRIIALNRLVDAPVYAIIYGSKNKYINNNGITSRFLRKFVEPDSIEYVFKNPRLFSSGLVNISCPMQTFQNIDMVLGDIQNIEKDIAFSNETIIEAKGFDNKLSFRKSKSKK